jgi:hypothetical protein
MMNSLYELWEITPENNGQPVDAVCKFTCKYVRTKAGSVCALTATLWQML